MKQTAVTGMTVKIAIALVLVMPVGFLCGLIFIVAGIAGGGDAEAAEAPVPAAAASGCGLREGSVPNGWAGELQAAASVAGIDPAMAAAQLQTESAWNPNAIGPPTRFGTAKGLAQFIDSTFSMYGSGSVFDPVQAIRAYGAYMAQLMQDMQPLADSSGAKVVELAMAAYNAGPGAVQQYGGVPPYPETQNYIVKIKERAATYAADCGGQWTHPLPGAVLTSPYGQRWGVLHAGIDLATPRGQAPGIEVAVTAMTITYAGCRSDGYGCSVVATAADGTGYAFRYGHIASGTIRVQAGQTVPRGTELGTMGNTGDSQGAHLHFEIYLPGAPEGAYASSGMSTNPIPILAEHGVTL